MNGEKPLVSIEPTMAIIVPLRAMIMPINITNRHASKQFDEIYL